MHCAAKLRYNICISSIESDIHGVVGMIDIKLSYFDVLPYVCVGKYKHVNSIVLHCLKNSEEYIIFISYNKTCAAVAITKYVTKQ